MFFHYPQWLENIYISFCSSSYIQSVVYRKAENVWHLVATKGNSHRFFFHLMKSKCFAYTVLYLWCISCANCLPTYIFCIYRSPIHDTHIYNHGKRNIYTVPHIISVFQFSKIKERNKEIVNKRWKTTKNVCTLSFYKRKIYA